MLGEASKLHNMAKENKSIRLVIIVSDYMVAEYSIFLNHLLVGLVDESVPVALVCSPSCKVDFIVSPAVEVIRYPAFNLPLLWHWNKKILIEQLEKFRPTILHCLCGSKALLTGQLACHLDLPYVLTVNSLQKRRGWLSILPKRCAKIIVPAESIATNIAKFYPQLAERIKQINIGTFVQEDSICFDQSGRLASMVLTHPLKSVSDFEKLLGAVRHLKIDGYEFMLVLTGGGRAEKRLRKLLVTLDLLHIVVIVPELEPQRAVVAAGDIFIQPCQNSAFNPLLLEAMSVGAAVAGCEGGVDDLIIKGQIAVVFDPDDELSIKHCLKQLLDRPEFARKLGRTAQEYLKENHMVSRMIADILHTYREVRN